MTTHNFEERLISHAGDFAPVVPLAANDKIISLDFTEDNPEMPRDILANEDEFVQFMYQKLQNEGARYGIGGYNEKRAVYSSSPLFGSSEGEEPRRLHLGMDIWGRPHTPVMAPMNGIIHSLGNNNNFGDYGATVVLSHQLDGVTFHTLYGHLSLNSILALEPGQTIKKGDIFAEFGMPSENGHWPPHLHFQIILDMEGHEGDYPGVCRESEKEKYLSNCPNPDLILQMMQYVKQPSVV